MSERMLKFTEFEVLANKLCPPQAAAQLIILAGMRVNSADDDSLDMNLAFLRNIDRTVIEGLFIFHCSILRTCSFLCFRIEMILTSIFKI